MVYTKANPENLIEIADSFVGPGGSVFGWTRDTEK